MSDCQYTKLEIPSWMIGQTGSSVWALHLTEKYPLGVSVSACATRTYPIWQRPKRNRLQHCWSGYSQAMSYPGHCDAPTPCSHQPLVACLLNIFPQTVIEANGCDHLPDSLTYSDSGVCQAMRTTRGLFSDVGHPTEVFLPAGGLYDSDRPCPRQYSFLLYYINLFLTLPVQHCLLDTINSVSSQQCMHFTCLSPLSSLPLGSASNLHQSFVLLHFKAIYLSVGTIWSIIVEVSLCTHRGLRV